MQILLWLRIQGTLSLLHKAVWDFWASFACCAYTFGVFVALCLMRCYLYTTCRYYPPLTSNWFFWFFFGFPFFLLRCCLCVICGWLIDSLLGLAIHTLLLVASRSCESDMWVTDGCNHRLHAMVFEYYLGYEVLPSLPSCFNHEVNK